MAKNNLDYLIGQRLSVAVGMDPQKPETLYVAEENMQKPHERQIRLLGEGHFPKKDIVNYSLGGIYFLDVMEKYRVKSGKLVLFGKLSKRGGKLIDCKTMKETEFKPVDRVELIIDKFVGGENKKWGKFALLSP